jgi:hypothetical protein
MLLEEIIKTLGGTAILVTAVAWLMRSIILNLLSKDVEKYKADLKLESERHRMELQKAALEHEIKFRRVDEKVAETISELYERLLRLFEAVHSYVKMVEWSHEPSKAEKLQATIDANREFNDFLFPKRLYIPKKLFVRIRDCGYKLADITSAFARGQKREEDGIDTEGPDHWMEAFDAVEKEVNPLFSDLVADFQKRIGVED